MLKVTRGTVTLVAAAALLGVIATRSAEAAPPQCIGDKLTRICINSGDSSTALPAGAKNEGRSGHSKPLCTTLKSFPTLVVPCSGPEGVWIQADECYAKALDPQPAKSDPRW